MTISPSTTQGVWRFLSIVLHMRVGDWMGNYSILLELREQHLCSLRMNRALYMDLVYIPNG